MNGSSINPRRCHQARCPYFSISVLVVTIIIAGIVASFSDGIRTGPFLNVHGWTLGAFVGQSSCYNKQRHTGQQPYQHFSLVGVLHSSSLSGKEEEEDEVDLFDVFDPRISPHMYPGGIPNVKTTTKQGSSTTSSSLGTTGAALKASSSQDNEKVQPASVERNEVTNDSSDSSRSSTSSSTSSSSSSEEQGDLFDVFDPRLSPHMYPGGIPDASTATTRSGSAFKATQDEIQQLVSSSSAEHYNDGNPNKIGILLIDHGSKREASNKFLEQVAMEYSSGPRCPPHFVVEAAHMEIATPTIEDGIRTLIGKGAYQIVCFPFFLGPGKHATEDVPRLVEDAKQSIKEDPFLQQHNIQIILSPSFTSRTSLLIDAMSQIINDTIKRPHAFEQQNNQQEQRSSGFFGEIQRLVEEEL